jgi:drug/metabolite transporter (DMT)-like permease
MPLPDFILELAPVLFALTSAVLFAISIQLLNLGLKHADPETGSLIHIASTTVFYWLLSPFFVESWYWLTTATLMFCAVGLFRPVLSANLALNGVRHLGPTLTSTLAATSPLFGVAFGVSLLGETLTLPVIAGTGAIMCGLFVMAMRRGSVKSDWPMWALALPLGAAMFRATGHVLTKIGYDEVASAFFAALISYTVSFIAAYSVHRLRGRQVNLRIRGLRWFVLAGLVNGVSVLSVNSALKLGQIVTVVPIVSASPFVTLLLTLFVFRREAITWRHVATMCLIVPGVILIAVAR